jgi:glycosyltransferase involved in cell wall biosynthesis
MISFIIPAHNEEELLGRTLTSLGEAAASLGQPFEIIVVNDASTDATNEVATAHGATVINVTLRQIGMVRNAGAKSASGDVFVFVDADTIVLPQTLRAALAALDEGAIGGGAVVVFDGLKGLWERALVGLWNRISRWMRWAAGCFVFVRRDAFETVGGFDRDYFIGEEIILSAALKRRGRFVVLPQSVVTSARKARLYGKFETLWVALRLMVLGKRAWRRREGLDMWYRRRDSSQRSAPRE